MDRRWTTLTCASDTYKFNLGANVRAEGRILAAAASEPAQHLQLLPAVPAEHELAPTTSFNANIACRHSGNFRRSVGAHRQPVPRRRHLAVALRRTAFKPKARQFRPGLFLSVFPRHERRDLRFRPWRRLGPRDRRCRASVEGGRPRPSVSFQAAPRGTAAPPRLRLVRYQVRRTMCSGPAPASAEELDDPLQRGCDLRGQCRAP